MIAQSMPYRAALCAQAFRSGFAGERWITEWGAPRRRAASRFPASTAAIGGHGMGLGR